MGFKMETTLGKILYNVLISIPIAFCLAFVGEVLDGEINWIYVLINFCISFSMSVLIGLFVPLSTIGAWFTRLCGGVADNYKGNIKYRLLSTLSISTIYFITLNPTVTFINSVILGNTTSFLELFINWSINIIPMFLTGFLSTLPSDYLAFHTTTMIVK